MPTSKNARLFYRAAHERFDDDFSQPPETGFWQDSYSTNGHQNGMLSAPLSPEESTAIKHLAQEKGLEDGDLIRGWVLEKLQESNLLALA